MAKKPTEAPVTVLGMLRAQHPNAHCELQHEGPFQLLCATVMSAQTTDVAVNAITPALFARFPDAETMAKAEPRELEDLINRIGMFRQKSKNLVGLARKLVADHGGKVPDRLDALVALPGVGRKTANVVLGVAFGKPEGVVVDTHVQRLSQRLGWSKEQDPVKIEQDLVRVLPRDQWDIASHTLIFHGRRVCFARKPNCQDCSVKAECPSAFAAELVGRKPARTTRTRPVKTSVPTKKAAPASKPQRPRASPKRAAQGGKKAEPARRKG